MNIPLNIDFQQILLHLLNFVILFAVLYFLLYNPVKKFMYSRTRYYENLDSEAKKLLSEAETAKAEYTEKIHNAEAEIEEKKAEARHAIDEKTEKSIAAAKIEAEKILADARITAENSKNKIIESAKKEIAGLVITATEKLAINSDTAASYEQFLSEVERGTDNE